MTKKLNNKLAWVDVLKKNLNDDKHTAKDFADNLRVILADCSKKELEEYIVCRLNNPSKTYKWISDREDY